LSALSDGAAGDEPALARLHMQGPILSSAAAGQALEQERRLMPVTVPDLVRLGFTAFAWVNPDEAPGGHELHPGTPLSHGGFIYHAPERKQWLCYRMALVGEEAPMEEESSAIGGIGQALDGAIRNSLTALSNSISKATQRENFEQLFALFNVWGNPTRGANVVDTSRISPPDAGFWERWRDKWLRTMVRWQNVLFAIAVFLSLVFVLDLIFIVVLWISLNLNVPLGEWSEDSVAACNLSLYNESEILFEGSVQYPPRTTRPGMKQVSGEQVGKGGYVAMRCTLVQLWFNIAIKYTTYYFIYINGLPIPWTLSTFLHVFYPRDQRAAIVGRDFYGRKSKSLWFHLPILTRKWVSGLMLFALIVQFPDAISHSYYYTYLKMNTWPGALITNVWLPVQLAAQISASVLQAMGEQKLRDDNPGKFPPTLTQYLKAAYRRWSAHEDAEDAAAGKKKWHPICCGEHSFYTFLMIELHNYKEETKTFGAQGNALTGIQAADMSHKRELRELMRATVRTTIAFPKTRSRRKRPDGTSSSSFGSVADEAVSTTNARSSLGPDEISVQVMSKNGKQAKKVTLQLDPSNESVDETSPDTPEV